MGRLFASWVLAASLATAQTPGPQGSVFRAGADTVPVFVTVTGKSGRLVPDLGRADFQIFDNGKPQPVSTFDNTPQPVRLIVLVDVSGSMSGNLELLRAACAQLIAQLGPGDLARVGTFGATIDISPTFTNRASELVTALPAFAPQNAPTPLWTAVDRAIGEFGTTEGRRVVLIMSDGKDTGPPLGFHQKWISQLDVADRAQREDVMIYGIGVQSREAIPSMVGSVRDRIVASLPDPGLGKVAEETGGGYFELRPREDLGAAFGRVADELHHQYLIGFTPPSRDGKGHKVEVRLTRKDMKPRARQSYRAPAASAKLM
jgi:Ca-activated chloride channel family protein